MSQGATMNTNPLWVVLLLASGVIGTTSAAERELGMFSVEFDPLTTPLGARNLLLYVEPDTWNHWSFSAIAFASDFPNWVDDLMGYRNADKGFDVRVRLSPGATVDRFFRNQRTGWHAGILAFVWRYEVARAEDQIKFEDLIIMPRLGFRWFLWENRNLYLDPFVGMMLERRLGGAAIVDGEQWKASPVLPFATIHVGYHF
ncbi:MAG: hypothetical protein R3E12_04395 [Candidatus Eisenbacteria bacterium]